MTKDYSKLSLEELQSEMALCEQKRGAYSPEKMTRTLDRMTCRAAIKRNLHIAIKAKREEVIKARSKGKAYRTM